MNKLVPNKRVTVLLAQMTSAESSPLTTHVLDTSTGHPASDLPISLFIRKDDTSEWSLLMQGNTNSDGRCSGMLTRHTFVRGVYRLHFDTASYFARLNTDCFYPYVDVVFQVTDNSRHHHVPLLLSPFGYSTYRGS